MAKVCIVTPAFFPDNGGVERHCQYTIELFANDGHEVTVFTKEPRSKVEKSGDPIGFDIVRLKWHKNKILRYPLMWIQTLRYMRILLKSDLVHFHDFQPLLMWFLPWMLLWRILGTRVYITFHGWEGVFPPSRNVILQRKFVNKWVNGSIAIGHFIEKWYQTPANYISYGAAHYKEYPNQKNDDQKFRVVFLGRFEQDTGIEDYCKAWPKFAKDKTRIELVLLGDGSLMSEIKNELSPREDVVFKGFVTNPEAYLADADVVLTAGYLGIVESLQNSKAVISFYDNELKKDYLEYFPDQKDLSICSNSSEIVDALNSLYQSNKLVNGAYYQDKYSWKNVVATYYELWGMK